MDICEEMDICTLPDLDMVAQAVLHWTGSRRQHILHAGATVQNTFVRCFRTAPRCDITSIFACWVAHSTFVCAEHGSVPPQKPLLGVELGVKEWFGLRVVASDVQL
jgi:hypothetical protein